MDNKLRLERLTELQGMLTHHDQIFKKKIRFDIDLWQDDCGTAACALGSACSHKPFIEAGLEIGKYNDSNNFWPRLDGEIGFEAGAKFFGITEDESQFLFDPDTYNDPEDYELCEKYGFKDENLSVKPDDVALRVAKLIEKYKEE